MMFFPTFLCVTMCYYYVLVDEFAPEVTKHDVYDLQKLFKGDNEELSVIGRLAAGACAGMTSTLVSCATCEFETFPVTIRLTFFLFRLNPSSWKHH